MSTNQIYYRFYVKYPQTNTSIPQNILATIVTAEELAVESLSRLSFSLQTPPDTVQIRVFNQQINQVKINNYKFSCTVFFVFGNFSWRSLKSEKPRVSDVFWNTSRI